ncbi:2'-5' RNA ligase family protein [Fodinibius salsisoli]|uniref:2'-5' RNA ligase family protein n=1 Tax=Fodinibius salsisoli TaxID=2820877 RepID=A0ABT3PJT9_9BACT|nr:2'-5' RNA ligase family protein [Fodinibius salsisoli]MCW9706135.1 2'-5' RNA ligase family protein [Fodinibius salsisoli]
MPKQGLYFIAILPPDKIANQVQEVKKEFVNKYDSKEAYNKPPHFTLIAPFKVPEKVEEVIVPQLIFFANDQSSFTLHLSGFNHFRDDVIFIDVKDPSPMQTLHGKLSEYLLNEMGFSSKTVRPNSLTPHMTVAYRDLTPANFERSWQEFNNRPFDYSFEVNSIYLLKHDYTRWQPFYEFKFAN